MRVRQTEGVAAMGPPNKRIEPAGLIRVLNALACGPAAHAQR